MYTIYCHIFPNGKRYIGITKLRLDDRWKNGNGYKTCNLVDRAIEKYGWKNVKHEILCKVDTKEEAEIMERIFIVQFNSNNPDYGYNILPGGDVAENDLTEEMRHKLGNGWRGKNRTEEEKRKIAEGVKKRFQRKESNGHFGMKASEESKKKMSESHKKRWENDNGRRIEASERMRKRFEDAEYKKRIMEKLQNCNHHTKPFTEERKKKYSEIFKGRYLGENSPCSKPVVQLTKDGKYIKTWANAGEAQRAGLGKRSNIGKCCNHAPHCKTVGGFRWEFAENYEHSDI